MAELLNFLQLTYVQDEEENISLHLLISKQLLGQGESQSEKVFSIREKFPYLMSFLLVLRVLVYFMIIANAHLRKTSSPC